MNKNTIKQYFTVSPEQRSKLKKQKPVVIWFTGISGAGKSTIANCLDKILYKNKFHTYILDGDNIRNGINRDLTFTDNDRFKNIERVAEVAKLFIESGIIIICSLITPKNEYRDFIKNKFKDKLFEIFIDTPIEIAIARDPKGLYKRALKGEIKNFTGIDSQYENPTNPFIHIRTTTVNPEEAAAIIYKEIQKYIRG